MNVLMPGPYPPGIRVAEVLELRAPGLPVPAFRLSAQAAAGKAEIDHY
ncbi:hypothetical protein [Microtetraspora fusca]|uniref:Uncharacterized protein n=1 Tax=Microtetraspora fusca TaxID=1997 RepID=A0ABW6V038_MICFU|nr:hypothetical protein [Microtetraspora fusca]